MTCTAGYLEISTLSTLASSLLLKFLTLIDLHILLDNTVVVLAVPEAFAYDLFPVLTGNYRFCT